MNNPLRRPESHQPMQPMVGGWLMLPSLEIIEAVGRAGYDFVGFDMQHGAHDIRFALNALQMIDALGLPSLSRIQPAELTLIARLGDFGIGALVIAMVDGPEILNEAVQLSRYQPDGRRSYGGQRYGLRSEATDLRREGPAIYAMIETERALKGLDKILAVPGLAGVHVGRADLSLALGLDFREPAAQKAILKPVKQILNATRAAGLHAAMHVADGTEANAFIKMGFDQIVMGSDIALLRQALARELNLARGVAGE
ncbi:MAG: HpcH/HpaI aldolase family protein [Candidatus Dormibacteraceae bacterium]